jgi:4-aminobutyrate aminotransferase
MPQWLDSQLLNMVRRSKQLFSSLETLRAKSHISSSILDVRGSGLMVGVEFASPTALTAPNPKAPKNMASRVSKKCLERGMLILTTSVFEVVRFIPPLTVSEEDMKKGCEIFAESVEDVVKEG